MAMKLLSRGVWVIRSSLTYYIPVNNISVDTYFQLVYGD